MEPYQNNPDFSPEQIEKASKACTAICMWALAMYQYHFVALGVAPKVGYRDSQLGFYPSATS